MCVPKVGLTDFTYNWAHNLFVSWVLGFLLWVVLCLETQSLTLVLTTLSLSLTQSHFPFFWDSPSTLCVFFLGFPTHTSKSVLLFIARGEWRCHDYSLTCANGGLIPSFLSGHSDGKVVMALELIPTFKGSLGSNTLEGTTGQPSTRYLQAMIPPTRLKTTERGLQWVFKTV